jgi:hypothetical protein
MESGHTNQIRRHHLHLLRGRSEQLRKALRINSDLEVFFDDKGRALFGSRSGKQLAAVETELSGWQEFVDRWLQAVEGPAPLPRVSPEEKQLKGNLEATVKLLRKLGVSRGPIEEVARSFVGRSIEQMVEQYKLTHEQIKRIVDDVVSSL